MDKITDYRELEKQVELLKKDFRIMEVNIDGTLKTMRADIDKTLHQMRSDQNAMRTDIERINTDAAKRSDTQTKWIIGAVVAAVIIIIGVLD